MFFGFGSDEHVLFWVSGTDATGALTDGAAISISVQQGTSKPSGVSTRESALVTGRRVERERRSRPIGSGTG
eukprot:2616984-Pleurochrysis_carterae.AAC.1